MAGDRLGSVEPVESRESLADRAYRRLRQAILAKQIGPGDRLSVPELAAQLGISRSPTREAILRLQREGLATSSPNRGAVVAVADGRDLRDLYDVREVLEGLVARQAAERCTDADRAELSELWAEHRRAVASGELERHMSSDLAFHRRLAQAAQNRRASEELERLNDQIQLALYSTASQPGNPAHALEEHRAILDAVLTGDPADAELAARRHIVRVKKSLPPSPEEREHAEVGDE